MLLTGHIENGAISLNEASPLPDGTPVEVFIVPNPERSQRMTREARIAMIHEIAASQPVCDWYVDVSRESIYD
jgi:hypothetical protein